MATKCDTCPLRKLDAFVDHSAEEAKFMQRFKVGELSVEPGTTLLTEGANAAQLYTVLSGQGLRTKRVGSDRRQVVSFVFPGDFLGLQAGVIGTMGHTVEATTAMTLCVFDRAELWSLFKNHPTRAFDMTWLAAAEEMFLGEALTAIGQRSALESVAWAMLRLFRRGQALGLTTGNQMPLPYRQQDLADALGLSLVHTNKTLAKFKARGMMTWADGMLTLNDEAALQQMIGEAETKIRPRPFM